jgi:hypothetical protein
VTLAQREQIQAVQSYLVRKSGQVGYRMLRPMATRSIASFDALKAKFDVAGIVIEPDCSEMFTLICHVVGAACPTGYTYESGDGNTATIAAHLSHHYANGKYAKPGAAILFDLGEPLDRQHIASVHIADPLHGDPVVFNHGAPGCQFMPLSWLAAGFNEPPIFASVANL